MTNLAEQFRQFDAKPGTADGFTVRIERIKVEDENGYDTIHNDDYAALDDERRAAWERGEWSHVGIIARGHCSLVCGGNGITFTLDTPGLWGIGSDSDEAHFQEVFEEECATLRSMIDDIRKLPLIVEVVS